MHEAGISAFLAAEIMRVLALASRIRKLAATQPPAVIPAFGTVSQLLANHPKRVYHTCRYETHPVIPGHHPEAGIHPTPSSRA